MFAHDLRPVRVADDEYDALHTHHNPLDYFEEAERAPLCDVCGYVAGRPDPRDRRYVIVRWCRGVILCERPSCHARHFTPLDALN